MFFKIVADTDKALEVTVSDFTGDLNDALEIEFVMEKYTNSKHSLCNDGEVTADVYKTMTAGEITVTGAKVFSVAITPEDTMDICGTFYWDARITNSDGKMYNVRKRDGTLGTAEILKNLLTGEA